MSPRREKARLAKIDSAHIPEQTGRTSTVADESLRKFFHAASRAAITSAATLSDRSFAAEKSLALLAYMKRSRDSPARRSAARPLFEECNRSCPSVHSSVREAAGKSGGDLSPPAKTKRPSR